MSTSIWFWIAFHIGVFVALAIDLISFRNLKQQPTILGATARSALWVGVSLAFNALVWQWQGADRGVDFLTGYLVEYSLSVDNIFVFVLIFAYFRVPPRSQHRALMWGILGALVMRGLMIWLGIELISRFHFVLYLLGAFLVVTAVRMFSGKYAHRDFESGFLMRQCRRLLPVTPRFHGRRFAVRVDGRLMLTPLALVLIVIDVTDLVFAVDSIPAVFAITTDQFIVYTSNICAILGLRSLYFLLAKLVDRFVFLQTGLAIVLAFVGIKMIVADYFPISSWISLGVIVFVLAVTITVSIMTTQNRARRKTQK